jgi:ORF6N domain
MPTKQPVKKSEALVPVEIIQNKIYLIRGHKVMLDRDLAALYGVETRRLNEQVKRNLKRFPSDFMYQLTKEETEIWMSQIAISNKSSRSQFATLKKGQNIKYLPYVFTELGVAMLSSILNSDRAVEVNIQIMRVFTKLREMMITQIIQIFEALRRLMTTPSAPQDSLPNPYKRTKAGFIVDKESTRKGHHAY